MGTETVNGQPCVFCGKPGTKRGEHALPHALVRDLLPDGDGPYEVEVGGEPHGNEEPHADRPKVPCCEAHNSILDERFEGDLQRAVRTFWKQARDGPPTSGIAIPHANVESFGEYFLKTMFLLYHRDRIDWFQDYERKRLALGKSRMWRIEDAPGAYDWMVDGSAPPPDFHLWVATEKPLRAMDYEGKCLPTFVHVTGEKVRHHSWCVGIAGLWLSWIYHRHGELELGQVPPGQQLWPPPTDGSDIHWEMLSQPGTSVMRLNRVRFHGSIVGSDFDDEEPLVVPLTFEGAAGQALLVTFQ